MIPDSNATTFHVESADDIEKAITLLRISYLYHVSVLRRTPGGEGAVEGVDVEGVLDELRLSDELRATFTRSIGTG